MRIKAIVMREGKRGKHEAAFSHDAMSASSLSNPYPRLALLYYCAACIGRTFKPLLIH